MSKTKFSPPIILEVEQDLDNDGWEDEFGTVHYDDRVRTPWGVVEHLITHMDGDDLVIDAAPVIILVSKKAVDDWTANEVGATLETNVFGVTSLNVLGRNGSVKYQLIDRDVEWSDRPGESVNFVVAVRSASHWTPEESQ